MAVALCRMSAHSAQHDKADLLFHTARVMKEGTPHPYAQA
jgi:hypothetical protein